MAYLVIRTDGGDATRVELKEPVTFGRSIECDVWLNDPGMSRRHCRIVRDAHDGGWAIEDLASRNGVYVNKARISGSQHLRDGDVGRVGPAKITFHEVGFIPERPRVPMPSIDSVDETLEEVAGPGLPRPRPRDRANGDGARDAAHPGTSEPRSRIRLPFQRPPARPIPTSVDGTVDASVDDERSGHRSSDEESFIRRWLRR
jgi:pSer/pThr/pTyr-binding forkhead associated (FHA) protein